MYKSFQLTDTRFNVHESKSTPYNKYVTRQIETNVSVEARLNQIEHKLQNGLLIRDSKPCTPVNFV